MKPYYQDNHVTIYNAKSDCVLEELRFDIVVTDPPYGVDFKYNNFVDDNESWVLTKSIVCALVKQYPAAVCMSFARLWELPPAKWAACWFKPGSVRRSKIGGWSTWEPVLLYGNVWKIANDMLRLPDCANHTPEAAGHPCPKPLRLFKWLLSGCQEGIVCDPFMGSGTTLRAAKDLNRKAIGVEIEEKYCEIAANRMCQEVLEL